MERVARQRGVERSDAAGNDLRPAAWQPMAKRHAPRRAAHQYETRPRRNHHAARLLDILLNREPDAHITCVMLMLDTDMRRAEALGMTWSDVSVENRSILIEQQFAADRSVRSPKSKKSVRRISISETLTSYLEFWKKEQAREMEAFGLEQVKGTPLVHSFERTKDRHPQVNFMDLNGFSRWFRNFSVENGFGKFEGVRTYHYVKETVDGETISKRYEHKEWLELRDYLRKHPKVREARHISTYKSEHLPYGYSGLSSHTATAATARQLPNQRAVAAPRTSRRQRRESSTWRPRPTSRT